MNTEEYKYSLCTKGGIHTGEMLNLVCVEPQCIQKSIICSICYYEDHLHHKIRPLKFVINHSKKHLKQIAPQGFDVEKIKASVIATRNKLLSTFDQFDRETKTNLGGIRNTINSIFIKVINQIELKNNRNDELLLSLEEIKDREMEYDSFISLMQRLLAGVPADTEEENEDLSGGQIEKAVKGIEQKVEKDIRLHQKNIKSELESFSQIIQKTADSLSIFENKLQDSQIKAELAVVHNAFAQEQDWEQ